MRFRSRLLQWLVTGLTATSIAVGSPLAAYAHGGGGGGHGGGGHGGGGGGHGGGGFGGGGHHGGGGFGGMSGGHHSGFSGGSFSSGHHSMGMSSPSFSHGMNSGAMGSTSGFRGSINAGGTSGLHSGSVGHLNAGSHVNQSIISNSHHGSAFQNGGGQNAIGHNGSGFTARHSSSFNGATNANGVGHAQGHHLTSLTHGSNGLTGMNQGHHTSQFLSHHGNNAGLAGNNLHHGGNNNLANLHNGGNGNLNHNHNGNWNHNHNNAFFGSFFWPFWFGYYNYGYPYYRYGYGNFGWGYPGFGYGLGYGGWCYPFFNVGLYGLGYGYYGYNSGYASGYGYATYPYGNQVAENQLVAQATDPTSGVGEFAATGEDDFRQGNYESAVRAWRHALLDDPDNGTLVLLMAQALFATGKFDEAAGAVEQAMTMLPQEQWGVVVSNYVELYPKAGSYTTQLRALEKAVKESPDSPALRFLVGYHYAFLGYPQDAVKQLQKVKVLAPQDNLAGKLLDMMTAKLGNADAKPAPAPAEQPPAATP